MFTMPCLGRLTNHCRLTTKGPRATARFDLKLRREDTQMTRPGQKPIPNKRDAHLLIRCTMHCIFVELMRSGAVEHSVYRSATLHLNNTFHSLVVSQGLQLPRHAALQVVPRLESSSCMPSSSSHAHLQQRGDTRLVHQSVMLMVLLVRVFHFHFLSSHGPAGRFPGQPYCKLGQMHGQQPRREVRTFLL